MFSKLKNFLNAKQEDMQSDALVPRFETLLGMKKEVLFLKSFAFRQSSNLAGNARSAFKGRGIEFEEIRPYQFGDDVRDIDWRVTARKNQPFTKLYMEEKDREVYIFVDLSKKMFFGTVKELKSVTAAKIAALLGFYALSYKDRVGFVLYDGHQTFIFEARRQYDYFLSVLKKIEEICVQNLYQDVPNAQSLTQSLALFEKKAPKYAVLFIISSFDAYHQELVKQLSALMLVREVYLIDIFDKLEAVCPPKGVYAAEYDNMREYIENTGKVYEKEYQAYFENKRKILKNLCLKHHNHYRPVQTDLSLCNQIQPI